MQVAALVFCPSCPSCPFGRAPWRARRRAARRTLWLTAAPLPIWRLRGKKFSHHSGRTDQGRALLRRPRLRGRARHTSHAFRSDRGSCPVTWSQRRLSLQSHRVQKQRHQFNGGIRCEPQIQRLLPLVPQRHAPGPRLSPILISAFVAPLRGRCHRRVISVTAAACQDTISRIAQTRRLTTRPRDCPTS